MKTTYHFQLKQKRDDGQTDVILLAVDQADYRDALHSADMIQDHIDGYRDTYDVEVQAAWAHSHPIWSWTE